MTFHVVVDGSSVVTCDNDTTSSIVSWTIGDVFVAPAVPGLPITLNEVVGFHGHDAVYTRHLPRGLRFGTRHMHVDSRLAGRSVVACPGSGERHQWVIDSDHAIVGHGRDVRIVSCRWSIGDTFVYPSTNHEMLIGRVTNIEFPPTGFFVYFDRLWHNHVGRRWFPEYFTEGSVMSERSIILS